MNCVITGSNADPVIHDHNDNYFGIVLRMCVVCALIGITNKGRPITSYVLYDCMYPVG